MKVTLGPYPDEPNEVRQEEIHIDPWDSWNADTTIAKIAYPVLVQLKNTKQGFAMVDPEDAPTIPLNEPDKNYELIESCTSELHWNFVLDEMIWAMKEISEHKPGEDAFYAKLPAIDREGLDLYYKRLQNGCLLFGKYFQNLWD